MDALKTRIVYTVTDPSGSVIPVSFPYLSRNDVYLTKDGVNLETEWLTPSTIAIPEGVVEGDTIILERITSSLTPRVDFTTGSTLTEESLDTAYLHNLYLSQERSQVESDIKNELEVLAEPLKTVISTGASLISEMQGLASDSQDALNEAEEARDISVGKAAEAAASAASIDTFTAYSISELENANPTTSGQVAYLSLGGRSGEFIWTLGDFTAEIAADTRKGVYLKADGVAASVGSWVRKFDGFVTADMFGGDIEAANKFKDYRLLINKAIDAVETLTVSGRNLTIEGHGSAWAEKGDDDSAVRWNATSGSEPALVIGSQEVGMLGARISDLSITNMRQKDAEDNTNIASAGFLWGHATGKGIYDHLSATDFRDGASFSFKPNAVGSAGNAVYGNSWQNCYSKNCNIGFEIEDLDLSPLLYGNMFYNFELDSPAGDNPKGFSLKGLRGSTFVGGKQAGTGTYGGVFTNFYLDGSPGIAQLGGHFEQSRLAECVSKGSSIMFLGHDPSFECLEVVAENPKNVTLLPSTKPHMGRISVTETRNNHSGGLFATQTKVQGIQGASIYSLNPNADFGIWPETQGTSFDFSTTVPEYALDNYFAGVWRRTGAAAGLKAERTTDSLFGQYALKITDTNPSTINSCTFSMLPEDVKRYAGERVCMSAWFKNDAVNPSPQLGMSIFISAPSGDLQTFLGVTPPTLGGSDDSEWGFAALDSLDDPDTDFVIPADAVSVGFTLRPTGNNKNNTGSIIVDGVCCTVGGVRVYDDVHLMSLGSERDKINAHLIHSDLLPSKGKKTFSLSTTDDIPQQVKLFTGIGQSNQKKIKVSATCQDDSNSAWSYFERDFLIHRTLSGKFVTDAVVDHGSYPVSVGGNTDVTLTQTTSPSEASLNIVGLAGKNLRWIVDVEEIQTPLKG